MEMGVVSSFVSVFISLGIVLITYIKTWVRLESSVQTLSKVVDRLALLLDGVTSQQAQIIQDIRVLETRIDNLEERIDREHPR